MFNCSSKSNPCVFLCVKLLGMLDMSVPVVAKFRRLLDSLPRETLPDVVASMIRTSNKEKLQVRWPSGWCMHQHHLVLTGMRQIQPQMNNKTLHIKLCHYSFNKNCEKMHKQCVKKLSEPLLLPQELRGEVAARCCWSMHWLIDHQSVWAPL